MLLTRAREVPVVEVGLTVGWLERRLGRREEELPGLPSPPPVSDPRGMLGMSTEARGVDTVEIVCMLFFLRGGK